MPNLKTLLRLNAASCLGFGVLFVALPAATAGFLGTPPFWLVVATGSVLIANGLHLIWASRRPAPIRPEIFYFCAGDAGWVLATLALIASGTWVTSGPGIIAALIVAIGVGALGALQAFAVLK